MRLIFVLFISSYCFSQQTYHGVVRDELNKPIGGVVLTIYKTETPTNVESILITDDDGVFQLVLESNTLYVINTRHLSYIDNSISFNTSTKSTIEIVLNPAENILEEIVIKHERPKITIKRDTISFDISKYIDANDRKLKDLVEKLPGITLQEDGSIYFKGEKITKLLVENEEFFGGGTKLGLDNIPADAIAKLEIIANYSKSNLLKNSRRTEAQVINLVLKENRKSIIFGSLDGATNFDEFYKMHASVFQFKPKNQNNVIADVNNIAEQSLSGNESFSISNVDSELFKLPEIPIDYDTNDRDYSGMSNKLVTANMKRMKDLSTWDFIGYYAQSIRSQQRLESQEYFNNNSFENANQSKSNELNTIYLRAKNYYQTAKKERVFASILNFNSRDIKNHILSNSNLGTRTFNDSNTKNDLTIGMLLEEVRPLKNNDNLVYGFKLNFDNKDNQFILNSNQQFLEDIIPWINQITYSIKNPNDVMTLDFGTGATYYKKINTHHSLLASSKILFELSDSKNNQTQQLDDSSQNELSNQFISNSSYKSFSQSAD